MRAVSSLVLLLIAGAAAAHPGHPAGGPADAGLWHLLTEPDHLAWLLAPLAAALGLWRWKAGARRAARRPRDRADRAH